MPELKLSFEPIDLTEKILSQGVNTPIEIRISGMMKKMNAMTANKLLVELKKLDYLRDQQISAVDELLVFLFGSLKTALGIELLVPSPVHLFKVAVV